MTEATQTIDFQAPISQYSGTKRDTEFLDQPPQMAGKVRHLLERNGRFFARLSVPEELRPIIGKRELLEAIGPGRREALAALPLAIAKMRVKIETTRAEARLGSIPARRRLNGKLLSPREMARIHYNDQLAFDEELRNASHAFARGFPDENYAARLRDCISGVSSNDEIQLTVGRVIEHFKSNGNTRVEPGTPEWRETARALATAELEALKRTAERDEGDFSGTTSEPLLAGTRTISVPADSQANRALTPDSQKPLSELLPAYLKERGAKARSDYDSAVTVRMLEEFMGEKRPLYKIARQDLQAFKRALTETPANYTKRFGGLSLPEAIKANKKRKAPFSLLNPKTINDKYLSKLHSLLNWCVRSDLIPNNPATGIKVEALRDRSARPRIPFAPSDLIKLFDVQYFKEPFGEFEWAMLISLFSGMRASELAQMKLDSIRRERSALVFAVEEDTKTKGSQRIIPIQRELLRLGFEARVTKLRQSGVAHLFPEWYRKGIRAKTSAETKGPLTLNHYFPRFIPKHFNELYLPKLEIEDPRKRWHSFRHTFKTGLARAGVSREIQDQLCGHSDYSAGGAYIHESSVEALKQAVDKLHFDGFPT